MNLTKTQLFKIVNEFPFIGIIGFVVLYIFAAQLYPGGSQADLTSQGFDWVNNYWCNLLNERGMNGQLNPARPFAIFAMVLLCIGFMVFFVQFAEAFSKNLVWKRIIQFCGIFSMLFATLIFTEYHDLMTLISSLFGLFAVLGIIKEVYKSDLTFYKFLGVLCILLLGANNVIYYSTKFIEWLPLLQKTTFLITLIWVIGLNFEIRKKLTQQAI